MNKNKLFIGDNYNFFKNKDHFSNKFKIVYMDPPYNTGNKFAYEDNLPQKEWNKLREKKIKEIKNYMDRDSVFIASISEESVFELYNILKNNFKYVFEPIVWLTKPTLNQNKITNISSVCHEYILIASDYKIKSKWETTSIDDNLNDEMIQKKLKRYKTSIKLKKDIEEFPTINIEGKEIAVIKKGDYEILNDYKTGFKNHRYQKRTAQKGHGSIRYIETVKQDPNWSKDNLYFLKNVKDKYGLNGKFLLGNSYFQSISNEIKIKMPSFLGFYNSGKESFQTAKPIPLLKRIFSLFADEEDFVLDMYGGSGNAALAANESNLYFYTFEIGKIEEIENNTNGKFISDILSNKIKYLEIIK